MAKYITVANGCSHNVYVSVKSDSCYQVTRQFSGGVSSPFGGGNVGMNKETEWVKQKRHGYTEVNRWSFMKFYTDAPTNIVFVTITNPSKSRYICQNYSLAVKSGIIVEARGHLRNAKKGKIWIDESGVNHECTDTYDREENEDGLTMNESESQSEDYSINESESQSEDYSINESQSQSEDYSMNESESQSEDWS